MAVSGQNPLGFVWQRALPVVRPSKCIFLSAQRNSLWRACLARAGIRLRLPALAIEFLEYKGTAPHKRRDGEAAGNTEHRCGSAIVLEALPAIGGKLPVLARAGNVSQWAYSRQSTILLDELQSQLVARGMP